MAGWLIVLRYQDLLLKDGCGTYRETSFVHIFEKLNFQKREAERGAATMRATLASEGEINSKN